MTTAGTDATRPADPDAVRDRLVRAYIDTTGGTLAWEMATLHFADGYTLDDIAYRFEVSRSKVYRDVRKVWTTATRHGLRPPEWKRPHHGGKRKPTLHGVKGNDLHAGKIDRHRNGKDFL